MPSSFQEEFISELSRASLGAYSIFEPDTYRKGSAIREPADLAWSSWDAVILLNMQSGGGTQVSQDRHNFRQLCGWLRAWERGRSLEGRNDFRKFAIPYDAASNILGISVTADPEARVQILKPNARQFDEKRNHRVSGFVSLPQEILLNLAKLGGTAVDLVNLLVRVAKEGGLASIDAATAYLHEERTEARARARSSPNVNSQRDEELDNWIHQNLGVGLRAASITGNGKAVDPQFESFNDLDWQSSSRLVLASADAFRSVRDVPYGQLGPAASATGLELHPYRFFVSAFDITKQDQFADRLFGAEKQLREQFPSVPVIGVHWAILGRPKVEFASAMLTFDEFGVIGSDFKGATAMSMDRLRRSIAS